MHGFETYRRELMRKRLSASVLVMAIPLYLGFSALDWMCVREHWAEFFWIRVASCFLLGLFAFLLARKEEFASKHIIVFAHLTTATLGVGIGYMSHITGGVSSPYYAGLNWIAIGSLAFWPGRAIDRAISIATIYGPLVAMEIWTSRFEIYAPAILALTFMAGTCLLSMVNNVLSLRSLEEEFNLRGRLEDLIRNKDEIIEIKSNESANLKRLAKQFSPAVIQAIESQTISLNERSRRKVAILFIDVVDSTARSNHLDYGDYQKTLDLFFEFTIKLLLARNITVANFTGDGIMAIANAPYKTADFEKVAFETGLQIIEETARRQRTFRELWHADFAVRAGISSGFVTVGFFPNTDFGVYTAIGEPVNLAARLCTAAEPNSVATTKTVIAASKDVGRKFRVKRGGSISQFKGFAANDLEYYLASPENIQMQVEEKQRCPLCNHALILGADLGDCIMVQCENCQYSDIQEKIALPVTTTALAKVG